MKKVKCRQCGKQCGAGFCSDACRTEFNSSRTAERNTRKAAGLCAYCNRPAVTNRTLCQQHAAVGSASSKKSWLKAKVDAFNGYGGPICRCCGTTIFAFLTIDHINGGGYKHRRQNKLTGSQLYRWLIKNKFPAGFRVLCFNCNSGRHVNGGVCPCNGVDHQRSNL